MLFTVIAAAAIAGESMEKLKWLSVNELKEALHTTVLITGIANGIDTKNGSLCVMDGSKHIIHFSCHQWPKEIVQAYNSRRKDTEIILVTLKVRIAVDPIAQADSKTVPTLPQVNDNAKYYFTEQELVGFETKDRPLGPSQLVGPVKPIVIVSSTQK